MHRDLTQGKIFSTLMRLALPIAGAQVMHMAYNLTDMFWLGQVSEYALAASGAAGLFLWLSMGFLMIGRIGAEVGVAQARGRGDIVAAYSFARMSIYVAVVLGTLYGAFLIIFRHPLVAFFNFYDTGVAVDTAMYTAIMAIGIPANFIVNAAHASFVASGNSRTPFLISSSGLILNMILTPIVVFSMGLGVFGAALSSVFSQYVVFIITIIAIKRFRTRPFAKFEFITPVEMSKIKEIFYIATPVGLENMLWPLLTIVTTRFELEFGDFALAMSRVGTQVESLSWLVGAGFGAALTAFVGQNFGAGKHDRIAKGVRYSTYILIFWGALVTSVLWFGGDVILAIFLPNFLAQEDMRQLFITYLRILAACQIFANLEYVASNAFRGKGRTIPPSISSITSNLIRVPLAFILSRTPMGVLGVWSAISLTSGLRGVMVCLWYLWTYRKHTKKLK
ncbi:MAG: MATE family efflux transporter [Defluviitaleaceae bacterium]|nr:MATE family efflux transporter [Defluviitaleaceae bacterium]